MLVSGRVTFKWLWSWHFQIAKTYSPLFTDDWRPGSTLAPRRVFAKPQNVLDALLATQWKYWLWRQSSSNPDFLSSILRPSGLNKKKYTIYQPFVPSILLDSFPYVSALFWGWVKFIRERKLGFAPFSPPPAAPAPPLQAAFVITWLTWSSSGNSQWIFLRKSSSRRYDITECSSRLRWSKRWK